VNNTNTPVATGSILVTLIPPDLWESPTDTSPDQYDLVPVHWVATLDYNNNIPTGLHLKLYIAEEHQTKYQFASGDWISHFIDHLPTDTPLAATFDVIYQPQPKPPVHIYLFALPGY